MACRTFADATDAEGDSEILNLTEASSLDAHIHTLHSVIASLELLSNTIEFPSIQTSSAARKRAGKSGEGIDNLEPLRKNDDGGRMRNARSRCDDGERMRGASWPP